MKKAVLFLGLLGGLVSCNSAPECGDKEVSKHVREMMIDNNNIVDWWKVATEYYSEDYKKFLNEKKEFRQSIRDNGYDISDDEDIDDYFSSKREKIEEEYNVKSQEIENKYTVDDSYNYVDVENYISERDKKLEELKKEKESMLAKVDNEVERVNRAKEELLERWKEKMDFVKKAYKQDDKIQEIINKLYSVEISNIRNVSLDKENKKCDCEATFKWVEENGEEWTHRNRSKEINFTAQRNTDGDLYIQVMKD